MQGLLPASNALFGLLAAALWGGGDFCGSIAVKRMGSTVRDALTVVVVGHLLSLFVIASLAWGMGEPMLHGSDLLWGVAGGVVAGISLVAFYMALASGHMGAAAAVSGLLCAAVPAAVSIWTEGNPGWQRLLGFLLAGVSIWFIASTGEDAGQASRRAMQLSILGGIGFGAYFVALRIAGSHALLWSLASARVGSASVCSVLLLAMIGKASQQRGGTARKVPANLSLAWILGGAALDTGGNVSFIAATRAGRLDVAAILASIYPAGTILLAAMVLHEKTTQSQKIGMLLALVAVVLITIG